MKPLPDNIDRFEELFLSFENAWAQYRQNRHQKRGQGELNPGLPLVNHFFASIEDASTSVWIELTMIDLEHRLRNNLPVLTDDYLELLNQQEAEGERDDLLAYEFSLRKKFNASSSDEELKQRFGDSYASVVNRWTVTNAEQETRIRENGIDETPADYSLLRPGAKLSQFVIQQQVGSGSFALVYLAIDERLQRRVAIKVLRPRIANDSRSRIRLLREAQAMASLKHPNIVPVLETGQHGGLHYIVCPFIDGVELKERIRSQPYSMDEAVQLVTTLAEAVAHAHQHGVVHRDIKPENVMITGEEGTPLLLDFGLAHFGLAQYGNESGIDSAHLTNIGDVVGTPAFMPPEQADGRAWQADPRSDIYSLGVLLFLMVCQRLPFDGSSTEVLQKLLHQPPPFPRKINSRISRDLQTIILKCLEKEPADRYQSAGELNADSTNVTQGLPINARPSGLLARSVKWSKRKPVMASLLAALLLATTFTIGIGTQLFSVRNERDRAQTAEQKARNAQRKLANLLATEAAASGQLAMQRGQLRRAIDYFQRSLDGGIDNPLEIRLMKMEALVATRQKEQAYEELTTILNGGYPDSFSDEVTMWKAELALDGYDEFGDAVQLFQQARQAMANESGAAKYLDAMLADFSLDALSGFREALETDPFHYRARQMLITMLISLGRIEKAKAEIAIAQELFPESDDFLLFQAIVLAHQSNLDRAFDVLKSASTVDQKKWIRFCNLIDRIANEIVIAAEEPGFNPESIRHAALQFSDECLPLLRERGWHFPPNIGAELSKIPELLITPRDQLRVNQVAKSFRDVVKIHPEGSLYLAYLESLASLQNQMWSRSDGDITAVSPDPVVEAIRAIEEAKGLPAFVTSVKNGNPALEFTYAMTLAITYKVDVEQNKQRMLDSVRNIETESIPSAKALRTITIGLLTINAFEPAIRFADAWIAIAGKDNFEAVWHRLMCDWHNGKLLETIDTWKLYRDAFPDNERMESLIKAARKRINKRITPTIPPESDDTTAKKTND